MSTFIELAVCEAVPASCRTELTTGGAEHLRLQGAEPRLSPSSPATEQVRSGDAACSIVETGRGGGVVGVGVGVTVGVGAGRDRRGRRSGRCAERDGSPPSRVKAATDAMTSQAVR